jgi:hypothetical protein
LIGAAAGLAGVGKTAIIAAIPGHKEQYPYQLQTDKCALMQR